MKSVWNIVFFMKIVQLWMSILVTSALVAGLFGNRLPSNSKIIYDDNFFHDPLNENEINYMKFCFFIITFFSLFMQRETFCCLLNQSWFLTARRILNTTRIRPTCQLYSKSASRHACAIQIRQISTNFSFITDKNKIYNISLSLVNVFTFLCSFSLLCKFIIVFGGRGEVCSQDIL